MVWQWRSHLVCIVSTYGFNTDLRIAVVGWLADQGSSRKFSFFSGLALLFTSTLMFALGRSPVILVFARCLQGVAAAVVYTVGLAPLVDTVGRNEVGAWMGSALSGVNAGVMIGPFIGGIIFANAGYLAVFATISAVIGLDFIARLFLVEKQSAQKWVVEGGYGTFSRESNRESGPIYRDIVSTQEEGVVENRTAALQDAAKDDTFNPSNFGKPAPDQPIDHRAGTSEGLVRFLKTTAMLLKSRGFLAAMYGGFVQITIITAFDSILPLFVHQAFGWGSSGGGPIFLALTIPSLAAPIVGAMSDRLGARAVVLAGFAIATLTLALLSLVGQDSIQHKILLCALLAVTGKSRSLW